MIRSMMGLAAACLLVGCGDAATNSGTATAENAAGTAAKSTTVSGENAETHTVLFKVPGMT